MPMGGKDQPMTRHLPDAGHRLKSVIARGGQWARTIKRDLMALWLAARDPRVPRHAKLLAGAVAAYALSPIDLIPDFIPILGYLDDLAIVPAAMLLAIKLVPADVMADLRAKAAGRMKPASRAGLALVIAIWTAATLLLAWLLLPARP